MVKLILFYMKIRCYITLKKFKKGNQREPNPSLMLGSQALKPLRYKALLQKCPNKRLYKQLYKLWINFSRKWLSIGPKFLCSSTLLVQYHTTKKKPYWNRWSITRVFPLSVLFLCHCYFEASLFISGIKLSFSILFICI